MSTAEREEIEKRAHLLFGRQLSEESLQESEDLLRNFVVDLQDLAKRSSTTAEIKQPTTTTTHFFFDRQLSEESLKESEDLLRDFVVSDQLPAGARLVPAATCTQLAWSHDPGPGGGSSTAAPDLELLEEGDEVIVSTDPEAPAESDFTTRRDVDAPFPPGRRHSEQLELIDLEQPANSGQQTGAAPSPLFSELPDELLHQIFWHLTQAQLCQSVAPVCRTWLRHAYDPVFWQHLDLSASGAAADCGLEQLAILVGRAAGTLKTLRLHARRDLGVAELTQLLGHCPHLLELDLGFYPLLDGGLVEGVARLCPRLRCLNLEGCQPDDQCLAQCRSLHSLARLNLSHCGDCLSDQSALIQLAASFAAGSLHALNLDGIPWISDRLVEEVVPRQAESLRALYLDGDQLTDLSVKIIASSCHRLEELSFSFCEKLSDTSLQHIQVMGHLQHLRVRKGPDLSGQALAATFAQTPVTAHLAHLDLTECVQLGDSALYEVARHCGGLRGLVLCWCWNVTDLGLTHLVEGLARLERLDLTGISRIQGHCLLDVPAKMTRLSLLDLTQCNKILDAVLCEVVKKKRDLTILNYYNEKVTATTSTTFF